MRHLNNIELAFVSGGVAQVINTYPLSKEEKDSRFAGGGFVLGLLCVVPGATFGGMGGSVVGGILGGAAGFAIGAIGIPLVFIGIENAMLSMYRSLGMI